MFYDYVMVSHHVPIFHPIKHAIVIVKTNIKIPFNKNLVLIGFFNSFSNLLLDDIL